MSDEVREKNAFEGNKWMFLSTLDEKAWQDFLSEFNRKLEHKVELGDFKDVLRVTVIGFGEPVLMATGLDEKARGELLEKMVRLREQKQSAEDKSCKDSSTPNEKTENKENRIKIDDKSKTDTKIKDINILKAREGEG